MHTKSRSCNFIFIVPYLAVLLPFALTTSDGFAMTIGDLISSPEGFLQGDPRFTDFALNNDFSQGTPQDFHSVEVHPITTGGASGFRVIGPFSVERSVPFGQFKILGFQLTFNVTATAPNELLHGVRQSFSASLTGTVDPNGGSGPYAQVFTAPRAPDPFTSLGADINRAIFEGQNPQADDTVIFFHDTQSAFVFNNLFLRTDISAIAPAGQTRVPFYDVVFLETGTVPKVPEPSTWLLLMSGLAGFVVWHRYGPRLNIGVRIASKRRSGVQGRIDEQNRVQAEKRPVSSRNASVATSLPRAGAASEAKRLFPNPFSG